jgi:hypothetical protein
MTPTNGNRDTVDNKYGIECNTDEPNNILAEACTTPASFIELACIIIDVPVTVDDASIDSTRLNTPVVPAEDDTVVAGMDTRALCAKVT